MITVVLADDHEIVRLGVRTLLTGEPGLKIVGEAGDGPSAVEIVEGLHPDLLIVDVMLPGLNGLDVITSVRQRSPGTRVIVLSMHANEGYVTEALKNGGQRLCAQGGRCSGSAAGRA